MNRRDFLAAAAAATLSTQARAGSSPSRFVTSDAGPLKRVLVHAPGPETKKTLALGGGDHPMLPVDLLGPGAADQHRAMVDLLKRDGAEVLHLEPVLDEAIARARAAGRFVAWLAASAPRLARHEAEVRAAVLLGAVDKFVYHVDPDNGGFAPLIDPMKFLFYTRDVAAMTPRGVVIANFITRYRSFESTLIRFMFAWSPELRRYPVVFDAVAEHVYLQGGDLIVADEETLFLGVGNLSEEGAARKLAQKLEMNVVAVQMPGGGSFRRGNYDPSHGLRIQFLHLDTIFNLLGPRSALVVPYFLESKYSGGDPLTGLILGLAERPRVSKEYMAQVARSLETVGQVRRYRAGTGLLDPAVKGVKLVDYLRDLGYAIHPIGGPPPEKEVLKHVVERVMREVRFQGGNVVATAPGRVIAYEGNTHTLASLRASGITVSTFPGHELVHWHGGPHCLTLPLERGDPGPPRRS